MRDLLLVCYYWPPRAGPGVRRWLELSRYLGDHGWRVSVLTPTVSPGDLCDHSDPGLDPERIAVYRSSIIEPYAAFRRLVGRGAELEDRGGGSRESKSWKMRVARWIRANLVIPDPRVAWLASAGGPARTVLAQRRPQLVISSGPPHSVHLVAGRIARRAGLPWIADFRDPWTSVLDVYNAWRPGRLPRALHRRLESWVVRQADMCLGVSPSWVAELEALGARRVHHLPNGFDPRDFEGETRVPRARGFELCHLGLLNGDRNPARLWSALEQLCATHPQFADDLRVTLGGVIAPEVRESIARHPRLAARVRYCGYVDHRQAIAIHRRCSLALVTAFRGRAARGNLPCKVYELLAAGRPILAFADPGADLYEFLAGDPACDVFDHGQGADCVAAAVLARYRAEVSGRVVLRPKSRFAAYDRSVQAAGLAELLREVADGRATLGSDG